MPKCPRCDNGKIYAAFQEITADCLVCNGTGTVSEEQIGWIEKGKKLKELRISKDLTLRKAATLLNLSSSNWSAMETGRVCPTEVAFEKIGAYICMTSG